MWKLLKRDIPETIDAYRLVPRLLVFLYGVVFYQTVTWFMALEVPNMAQSGFVSVIVGAGAAWFGLYVNSGRTKIKIDSTGHGSSSSTY
jgi:hypothetical protein